MNTVFRLFLLVLSPLALVFVKYYEYRVLQLPEYLTNQHYLKLSYAVSELRDPDFFDFVTVSVTNIFTPEPVLSIVLYGLSFILAPYSSFLVVVCCYYVFVFFLLSKISTSSVLHVFFFLPLLAGFYDFVMFALTHRLKIAVILFFLGWYFASKNRVFSAVFFIALALFTHFSIILFFPLVLFYLKIYNVRLCYKLSKFFVIFSAIFVAVGVFFVDKDMAYFGKILHYIDANTLFLAMLGGSLGSYLLLRYLRLNLLAISGLTYAYISCVVYLIGTSRSLMMFYIFFYFSTLFVFLLRKNVRLRDLQYQIIVFTPFYLYNLSVGVVRNPLFTGTFIF
jgi:hypothetical protein